jgi:hypothetical protein
VGDEEVGQVHLLLKPPDEVHDLSLDGYVKGGDRLVAHNQLGFHRQGARDPDPLTLPA